MFPGRSRDKFLKNIKRFLNDERGSGFQDSPFMIFLAIIMLAFAAVLGIYVTTNFLDVQRHAKAVDATEKLYNAADLLGASVPGASRTLWISIPEGYSIKLNDNISLLEDGRVVGAMRLKGYTITGDTLEGGDKHHIKLEITESPENNIAVSSI